MTDEASPTRKQLAGDGNIVTCPDVLRAPGGLDAPGTSWWNQNAPRLLLRGLLNEDTRPDIVWMARLFSRCEWLRERSASRGIGEVEQDAAIREWVFVDRVFQCLCYRYGLTTEGEEELDRRGSPGSPNPVPGHLLE